MQPIDDHRSHFAAALNVIRERAINLMPSVYSLGIIIALFGLTCQTAQAQTPLSPIFWECQTNGSSGGQYPTQDGAIGGWLALWGGQLTQTGPCEPLGTDRYRFCPICCPYGQPGGIDVPMICPGSTPNSHVASVDGLTCPIYYVSADPDPLADCGQNCNSVGDPISPSNGNVSHQEKDIEFLAPASSLEFRRFYNSLDSKNLDMAVGWRHSYTRKISVKKQPTAFKAFYYGNPRNSSLYASANDACTIGWNQVKSQVPQWQSTTASFANGVCTLLQGSTAVGSLPIMYGLPQLPPNAGTTIGFDAARDDGQVVNFFLQGGSIVAPTGSKLKLEQITTGFKLTTQSDDIERYDTDGKLISISNRSGTTVTMAYDSSQRLISATDNFGHMLSFGYNSQGRLASASVPGHPAVQYGYDAQERLSSVTQSDGSIQGYVYENASFPNALTGVNDEENVRHITWGYDGVGRGISTQEAGGADAVSMIYNADGSVTTTDALGAIRTFSFQRIGYQNRPTNISGSQCPTCSEGATTTYDSAGFVSSRKDYSGNLTCYSNDSRGLELVRVEGLVPASTCPSNLSTYSPVAKQRKITTQWHSTFHLPVLIARFNHTIGFTYDSSGNTLTKTVTDTSVIPNVTRTWTYTYNIYGQVLSEDGPRTDVNDITTYTHYTCTSGYHCGQLQTATNAAGQITTYNTYNAHGQPLTITDPNGIVTTLMYDTRQRLTSRQIGSETTTLTYRPTGLPKRITLPDTSYLEYTYDGAHRLTRIDDSQGNYIAYTLDAMGNRTAENAYDPTSALSRTRTRVYNSLNQLWKDIGASGTAAVTTVFGYDNNGNQLTAAAPLSRNTTQAYDELNRLKQITDPASGITQFTYDANDNLLSIKDPRNLTTHYTYSGFGDLKTVVSPGLGTTTNTYDSAGNLATSTDARGAVTTYSYDALNRVTSTAFKLGAITDQTIAYTYDAGTNGKGRLTGASDASHSMSWSYDPQGRVTSKSQTLGAATQTVSYGYTNGRLTSMTTPSGQSIVYGYTNGRIGSVSINGTTLLSNVLYEPFGAVRSWTWGNGTLSVRTHDLDGNTTQIDSAGFYTYGHDDAFRITSLTDSGTPANNWTYGYDALDRLTSAVTASTTQGWTYDANGNRLTQTGTQPATYSIQSTNNRILSITGTPARTYNYNAAGSATQYASNIVFGYNYRGRMTSATIAGVANTFVYNALGERVKRAGGSAGTLFYAYDEGGHILGEYWGNNTLLQETIWMDDTPVALVRAKTGGVDIYYTHTDHLNTPRRITRPSDNKLRWKWDSDPFGTVQPNENPQALGVFKYNMRFPGQYYDPDIGLSYNYFRDYDPAVGRYLESDPIGLRGGINTYAYVRNNSLSLIDPFGLAECDVDDMTELAEKNNPDMKIVRPIWFSQLPRRDGSITAGYVSNSPFARPQINRNRYGGELSPEMRLELYNTIVHENWHANQQLFIARIFLDDASELMAYYEGDSRAERARDEIIKSGTGSCGCKPK